MQLLKHFFQLRQFLFRLLQLRDLLAQLLIGLLQRIDRRLLRSGIVLGCSQRILRLLHLVCRFGDGLRGLRRVRTGFLLRLLRGVLQLALFRRFCRQIFFINLRGVLLELLFIFNQLANLFLQFLERSQCALRRSRFLLGFCEFLHQIASRLFQTGQSFFLFRRRLLAHFLKIFFRAEDAARLLHAIHGALQAFRGHWRKTLHIPPYRISPVHQLGLARLDLLRVLLVNLAGFISDGLLLLDGLLDFPQGLAQRFELALGKQKNSGDIPQLIAHTLLISSGAKQLGCFEVVHRGIHRRLQSAIFGLFNRQFGSFRSRPFLNVFGNLLQLFKREHDLVFQGFLIDLLDAQAGLLRLGKRSDRLSICFPGQRNTQPHILRLALRILFEPQGQFIQGLLPLIFEHQLL